MIYSEIGDFTTTGIFLIVSAVIWLAYDIWAYATKGSTTISAEIRKWSYYSPVIPFIFGLLMGHWFW